VAVTCIQQQQQNFQAAAFAAAACDVERSNTAFDSFFKQLRVVLDEGGGQWVAAAPAREKHNPADGDLERQPETIVCEYTTIARNNT
jgi:hypothetical protein